MKSWRRPKIRCDRLIGRILMHLSSEDIAALEGLKKAHFLNEGAVRLQKSLGDAVGLKHLGIHLNSIEPGQYSTEYHCHQCEEEAVYILSGTGTATIDDEKVKVGPGDFMGFPVNGVAHDLYNDGDEPLVFLVVGQRLDYDICDYPNKGLRLFVNKGEWNLVNKADIQRSRR